ncbi:hypothetical protein PF005_g27201 [Phytophthora fragariae]|uniref:SET domain-containing protein n=1 Tax=Phytophthora fragariae TaxID=53985 RepID=A0A6A3VPZ0_9STRA|nr:hypothetical protein PF003_g37106 [Phytophthora fragariae]KAE8921890.1 hypothetical protein PF009_g27835 [Phytophthora fragariae]KAE8970560.1 hypothetical protein PF011_g26366 [Phytophthora fragariae]KAE9069209.1 hypothetical protein PF010_g26748 [Phytophthora fragariae]KAE9069749.1 hypothetical protein PF007_g27201 [Phytophthora fragariae]
MGVTACHNGNFLSVSESDRVRLQRDPAEVTFRPDLQATQNRSSVKVIVKMIEDVKAGAQITVNYGKERWFTCACDDCWQVKDEDVSDEQEAQASAK